MEAEEHQVVSMRGPSLRYLVMQTVPLALKSVGAIPVALAL